MSSTMNTINHMSHTSNDSSYELSTLGPGSTSNFYAPLKHVDIDSLSTGVPKTSTFLEDTSPTRRRRNRMLVKKWTPVLFLLVFLIMMVTAIVLTGVFFLRSEKKTLAKHSFETALEGQLDFNFDLPDSDLVDRDLTVGLLFEFDSFQPGGVLSYTLGLQLFSNSSEDPPTGLEAIPVCIVTQDPNSLQLPVVISLNELGTSFVDTNFTSSGSLTTDGVLSKYPLDKYTSIMQYVAVSPLDRSFPCESIYSNSSPAISFDKTQMLPIKSVIVLSQQMDGFDADITDAFSDADNDPNNSLGNGMVQLTFTVHRRRVIQFFAIIMLIATWLMSIAIIVASIQAIIYKHDARYDLVGVSTALLFALPTIRGAEPGIPQSATVYDAVGYYWQIALLTLSTFALVVHAIYLAQVKKKEENTTSKKDA